MSDIIISVENLGKCYRISHQGEKQRYTALRDVLANKVKGLFGNRKSEIGNRKSVEDFWALKDVSFEVKRGEVVGIIGRNGAGKSTLLKILSRITEPTTGRVHLRGRVASLLEVGTGFHPELTGRENIYLNGAIQGMSRAEIRKKFDEIVAFAEVEKFLDTPVKRYSSGMYVRLAFAVAAHLEPEILIVDEVLAVGDAVFQKKCMGKMEDVSRGGRTVLFVSHNMDAVNRLCGSAVFLEQGQVVNTGKCRDVVARYLAGGGGTSAVREWKDAAKPGNETVRLISVQAANNTGTLTQEFDIRQEIVISMTYEVLDGKVPLVNNLNIFDEKGKLVFVTHDVKSPNYNKARLKGQHTATVIIPGNLLAEGRYGISAAVVSLFPFKTHFYEEQAIWFQVFDSYSGESARGLHTGEFPGIIRPLLEWKS
jgi:lipopolysaccharide transport system ATP-binding protein